MARSAIPDPMRRRHLVVKELDAAQARRIAGAYLEAGRVVEAIDFLAMAEATQELESIRERAVEEGDGFLLKAAATALGREPSADEWARLAEVAEAEGRLRYAATARRQIEGGGA